MTTAGSRFDREASAALGGEQELKGYRLGLVGGPGPEEDGTGALSFGRVYESMLLQSPVRLDRFVQPRLAPGLVVVLGRDVAPEVGPGAAYAATGGTFLAIEFLDSVWEGYDASGGGFLLGERLLDGPLDGTLSLYLDGELLVERPLEAVGDPGKWLAWLAREVGGLRAGQVVCLGSSKSAPEARAGTLELRAPNGSALIARIEE